jgi:sec-independent protein translocase protein TatB
VFDIGTGEMLALAVLALLVLGPDKLPRYAAEAARFLRQVRSMASDARSEVRRELGPELDGLGLRELNPRALVRKHVLEGLDNFDDDEPDSRSNGNRSGASRGGSLSSDRATPGGPSAGSAGPAGATGAVAATPYDTDAT